MTDEQAEVLGRWLLSCEGFRWMPGMLDGGPSFNYRDRLELAGHHWRVVALRDYGHPVVVSSYLHYGDGRWEHTSGSTQIVNSGELCWPDLRDPATLGCVMALVRERHGRLVVVRWECSPDLWHVFTHHRPAGGKSTERHIAYGNTEAEALVAAMEAAR